MGTFRTGQRALHKLIAEPEVNKAAIMDTLVGMESAALTAISQRPPAMQDIPQAKQALWYVGYRLEMSTLLQAILSMEDATLRGDKEALRASYEELGQVKQSGHETYRDV